MANTGNQIDNPFKALNTNTDENPFAKLKKKDGGEGLKSPSNGLSESQSEVNTTKVPWSLFTKSAQEAVDLNKVRPPDKTQETRKVLTQAKGKPNTSPFDMVINDEDVGKAHNTISEIMFGSGEEWKDPVKAIGEKVKGVTDVKDLNALNIAANVTRNTLMPDGFDAKRVYNENEIWKGQEATNQTAKMLKERADKYDQNVAPLKNILGEKADADLSGATGDLLDMTYTPDLKEAAVEWYATKNPQFAKELNVIKESLEKEGWDKSQYGGKIPVQLWQRISSGKMGQIQQMFLGDPDVQSFAFKERPNLVPAFKNAQEKILTDNPEYGINQVANEVSRARQSASKNNPIIQYYGEHQKEVTNQIAEELYKDDPKKMAIYNQHIRDHQNDYIDAPSFFEKFAQGGKDVFNGLSNTITEPFTSTSETIRDKWKQEASNVSADPQGFSKIMSDIGHGTGFVASIIASGELLGGAAALNPTTANAIMTAGSFLGDSLAEGKAKFPDSPVKAWTSAILKTGLYTALSYEIFPGGKVKQAISRVEPELNQVVQKLVSGEISREAAKMETTNLFKKAVELGGTTLTKNARIAAEMTGIKMITDTADKLMGAEPHDENYGEIAKSAFLSNILVAGLAARGEQKVKNKLAEESYYEAASNPKQYERVIQEAATKNPSINADELLGNLKYLSTLKTEMDNRGVPEDKQKKVLLNSIQEKVKSEQIASMPESAMTRRTKEEIRGLQEDSDRILKGQEGQLSEAVDYGGTKGEVKEEEISKPVPLEPKLPENYQTEISKPIELSKELPEGYKLPEQPTPSAEVNIPKSHVPAAEFSAKESAAIDALSTKDLKGTALEHQGEVLKDPTASPEDKRQALREISDQLTAKGTEAETGQILGKEADLVYDLGYEPPKESVGVKELTAQPAEAPPPGAPGEPTLTIDGEKSDKTGIKNAISRETRLTFQLPKVELPKIGSDMERLDAGKKAVDSGEINPEEVVSKVLEGKGKTGMHPKEAAAMQYYMHQLGRADDLIQKQLSLENLEAGEREQLVSQRQQLSDLMDRATEANMLAGTAWSDVGNTRQILIDAGFNPSREKSIIKEAYGGEIPKDVKVRLDAAIKERDEAIQQRTKLEEELRQKEAELQVAKMKKSGGGGTKSKTDYSAKRKTLLDDLQKAKEEHEKWMKDNGIQKQGLGFTLTGKMIKIIGDYAKTFIDQGAEKLSEVIDKVYDEIKGIFPGIDKKEIRDAIAAYHAEKLETKATGLENKTPEDIPVFDKLKPKFQNDTRWVKANQRVGNAEYKIKGIKKEALNSDKNIIQRGFNWGSKLFRASVLSGYNVLYKLAAAATIGGVAKRIPEQAIGQIWARIFRGIAEKAPIEGFTNAKSEAKFYKEFFNAKKFVKNSWEILKGNESDLSRRLGEPYEEKPKGIVGKVANRILSLPTDLHQVIKDPVKRSTFEASFRNGLIHAEKNGLDINDPLVINSIETAAYKRANYEIFMESNKLTKAFTEFKNKMEKSGNIGAAGKFVANFLIPVSTVPTNIARRLLSTSPLGLIRGGVKVKEAYRKGIENLTNEEADAVMRQLKQGSLGTALWMIGWFGSSYFGGLYSSYDPNKKRKEGELASDEMEINGERIPKPVQHALPLEVIQWAATMRHIYDNYKENKGTNDFNATWKAGLGAIGALAEQVPIIETPVHLINAAADPYEGKKLEEDITRRFEPQILRETGVVGNQAKPLQKLKDKYADSEAIFKNDLKAYDSHGKPREISSKEFSDYKKARDTEIEKNIEEFYIKGRPVIVDNKVVTKKYDELSDKDQREEITKIKSEATKKIKEEMLGKEKKTREEKRAEHELQKAKQKEK